MERERDDTGHGFGDKDLGTDPGKTTTRMPRMLQRSASQIVGARKIIGTTNSAGTTSSVMAARVKTR